MAENIYIVGLPLDDTRPINLTFSTTSIAPKVEPYFDNMSSK
jgi:hypothetical protein